MRWKKNRVLTLKLRNGHYAVVQMLEEKNWLAVFNLFLNDLDCSEVSLVEAEILFVTHISTTVLKHSELEELINIDPKLDISIPKYTIHIGSGFRKVSLWENTNDPVSLLLLGEGVNRLYRTGRENGALFEEFLDFEGNKDEYELNNLSVYPNFNERLLLCEHYGKNFDPFKELAFNNELEAVCRTSVKIMSGIDIKKVGY